MDRASISSPRRIEAVGSPAVLTSPIDHLQATAGTLQHNLIDKQIYLDDRPGGRGATGPRRNSRAESPLYAGTAGHEQTMFQLVAGGPGWLRADMAARQAADNGRSDSASRPETTTRSPLAGEAGSATPGTEAGHIANRRHGTKLPGDGPARSPRDPFPFAKCRRWTDLAVDPTTRRPEASPSSSPISCLP